MPNILALNNRLPRSGRISYLFSRWLPTRNLNHSRSFFTGHRTQAAEKNYLTMSNALLRVFSARPEVGLAVRYGSHQVCGLAFAQFATSTSVPALRLPPGSVRHLPSAALRSSNRPKAAQSWFLALAHLPQHNLGAAGPRQEIAAQCDPA